MRTLAPLTLGLLALTGCITEETEPAGPSGIRETGYLSCAPEPDACGDRAVQCLGPDGAAECVATPACLGAPDCACAGNLCGDLTCFDQPAGGFRCGPGDAPDGGPDLDFGVDAAPDLSVDLDGGQRPDRQVRDMDPFAPDSSTVVCTDNRTERDCLGTPEVCAWDGRQCHFGAEQAPDMVAAPAVLAFGAIPPGDQVVRTLRITNGSDFDAQEVWLSVRFDPVDVDLTLAVYEDDPDSPLGVYDTGALTGQPAALLDTGLSAGASLFIDVTARRRAEGGPQAHTLLLSIDSAAEGVLVGVPITVD